MVKSFTLSTLIVSLALITSSFVSIEVNNPLTLGISNKQANTGSTVCLDVYAKDFKSILSMQYSMTWDPSLLDLKEITKFGLPTLGINNFGLNRKTEGTATFSWYDPNLQGLSYADGHTLYQLCFEVKGKSGQKAKVQFDAFPTKVEITNDRGVFLDLNPQDGLVKIQ